MMSQSAHGSVQKNRYIFDLDGTLALVDHRRPALQGARPDWHSFNKASLMDPPNEAVVRVARALFDCSVGYEVWITSGRSDAVALETRGWLSKHAVPFHQLLMRPATDSRADAALKREWAVQYDFANTALAVFDDRNSVVEMWRELGVPCFQVAPGDF